MREDLKIIKELKKFTVTDVYEKKNGFINPVVVTFQNGELNEKYASQCDVSFATRNNDTTTVQVISPSGDLFRDSSCNEKPRPTQIVAIRNKKTHKVRLVEVDHVTLINAALLIEPEKDTEEVEPVLKTEVHDLRKIFGGKKIANRLKESEKLNVSSLPVANEVQKVVESIEVTESEPVNKTADDSILHLLPPCHRDASVLSEVYNFSEIISEEELQELSEGVNQVLGENYKPDEFTPFFNECYLQLKKHDRTPNALAGLLFAETLIKFVKLPSKRLGIKNLVLCSFSSLIHDRIMTDFCVKTQTSVTRPLSLRDKTLCYIIVLGLICCNFQINLRQLAKTVAIDFKKLIRLAQIVGASPNMSEVGVFTLKLPLPPLPKSSKGKMKRQ